MLTKLAMLRAVCWLSVLAFAFAQSGTNGQLRFETIGGQTNRQFSYVGPDGETGAIRYTAGRGDVQVQGDNIPIQPDSQRPSSLTSVAPHQFPQTGPSSQLSPFSFISQARQLPGVPQFPQLADALRFGQLPQPSSSQQGLFVPATGNSGFAASRGQVAQFDQEQTSQSPPTSPQFSRSPIDQQFPVLPPQFNQFPQQISSSAQYPAGTQLSFSSQVSQIRQQLPQVSQPQFTQEQIPLLNQQPLNQQGPAAFPDASHRFNPSALGGIVSADPSGAYNYQLTLP